MSITPEGILNKVFGSKNLILNSSNNNDIHVGDQHIFFDLTSTSLKTTCPKCREPAEETEVEENETYKAFECSNCGHKYYEHDLLAKNVSSYLDLDSYKGQEFERLISAINHDIKVGDFDIAYNRCINHKETYGNTPQIYEWGALTVFYNTPIEDLIKTSCSKIILYLERSLELSKGEKSESYEEISSSIATRYFRAVYNKIFFTKLTKNIPEDADKDQIRNINIDNRLKVYRLLLELRTCYQISQDTDFAIKGLEELYGYKRIAWFKRSFSSIFSKMKTIPKGFRRGLKGYAWDYHKVIPNGGDYFHDFKTKPEQLAIYFEDILISKGMEDNLSEIRVGGFFENPVSARANLTLISLSVHLIILLAIGLFWFYVSIALSIVSIIVYGGLIYLNKKSNQANVDRFRRIIDIKREGDIKKTINEVAEELDLNDFQQKVKESLKIKNK